MSGRRVKEIRRAAAEFKLSDWQRERLKAIWPRVQHRDKGRPDAVRTLARWAVFAKPTSAGRRPKPTAAAVRRKEREGRMRAVAAAFLGARGGL